MRLTTLQYFLVDVFTDAPLQGNPLAVFPNASGMTAALMQQVARELNLCETTFVLPEPAEQSPMGTRVRIFTPAREMQFAGHPTIGTAHVISQANPVQVEDAELTLLEQIGPVNVRVETVAGKRMYWLRTPPIEELDTFPADRCAAVLSLSADDLIAGIPCRLLSAGNPNLFVPVRDPVIVDRAALNVPAFLDMVAHREQPTCLYVFAPTKDGAYSRMFAPQLGVAEDPATGSAAGPLALFMAQHGLCQAAPGTRLRNIQGARMGRHSVLHILIRGEATAPAIDVGGQVADVGEGTMRLPTAAQP